LLGLKRKEIAASTDIQDKIEKADSINLLITSKILRDYSVSLNKKLIGIEYSGVIWFVLQNNLSIKSSNLYRPYIIDAFNRGIIVQGGIDAYDKRTLDIKLDE